MEKARDRTLRTVSILLNKPIDETLHLKLSYMGSDFACRENSVLCQHRAQQTFIWIHELKSLGIWPLEPRYWNLETTIELLKRFPKAEIDSGQRASMADCRYCRTPVHEHALYCAREIELSTMGLCIECIRSTVTDGNLLYPKGVKAKHLRNGRSCRCANCKAV